MFFAEAATLFSALLTPANPNSQVWISSVSSDGVTQPSEVSFELGDKKRWVVKGEPEYNALKVNLASNEHLVYIEELSSKNDLGTPILSYDNKAIYKIVGSPQNILARPGIIGSEISLPDIKEESQEIFPASNGFDDLPYTPSLSAPVTIDESRLLNVLKVFTGEKVVPGTASTKITERNSAAGRELTQNYIMSTLSKLGYTTQKKCYGSSYSKGCNIEATLWGNNRKSAIYFTAHYDSITRSAADDNGSGISALVEVATLLSGKTADKTVRFVFFDQEEIGLVGSAAYAKGLKVGDEAYPVAVFNFDTLGYDSDDDGKIHVMDCDRADSAPLQRIVLENIAFAGTNLVLSEACTNRSDHSSFWNKNIPAVVMSENFFGGDSNNCYHQACDTISNMNMNYYHRQVTTIANVAFNLAGVHSTSP